MNQIIAWFASNRVAANVMMMIILAGGLISIPVVKKELFPAVALDIVEIQIAYPGADPNTVEKLICQRVEEAVDGLANIKSIKSHATSGQCSVNVTAAFSEGTDRLQSEIKNQVDGISSFPADAERPRVKTIVSTTPVLSVVIAGDVGEATLTRFGEEVRRGIAALPSVTLAELGGVRKRELAIEISQAVLRRYGLTLNDIAAAIEASSLDLPAGVVKSTRGDIRLRTRGQGYRSADFAEITVLSKTDGTQIRIKDIARIEDGFAEEDRSTRFDGEPAVFVEVKMARGQDMLQITESVRRYVEELQATLPEGLRVTTWADDSVYLQSRIDTLTRNAISGLLLVLAVLLLVLHVELALWVAIGAATAFLGALWFMPYQAIALSMLTMFAFILVLGIVVDDTIIISESIYARVEHGADGIVGAIEGTIRVAKPVIFSALTTMIAFAPMLFIGGPIGREIKALPILIITILAFSLFECLLILPAHLSHLKAPTPGTNRIARRTGQGLAWLASNGYMPVLNRALAGRYSVLALFTALSILTWSTVNAGWIRMQFDASVPSDWIEAKVTLPTGSGFDLTRQVLQRVERAALELRADLAQKRGANQPDLIRHIGSLATGNDIQVFVETTPAETRETSVGKIAQLWRQRIGDIPEAEQVEIMYSLDDDGKELEIELSADDPQALQAASRDLMDKLARYDGVYDLGNSTRRSARELEISMRPQAQTLDLTLASLARQVRQGFYGEEVQRMPRDTGDVKVVVRYPEEERRSLAFLEAMRVTTDAGVEVPFHTVAQVRHGYGEEDIRRKDRRRVATVEANVDDSIATADQILDELEDSGFWTELRQKYPNVHVNPDDEQAAFLSELTRNGLIALVAVYALMAIAFKSYLHPIVVMTAIPFGFMGAVIGHTLFGLDLSMNSLLGMVAASGVVINDNLVLIDAINRARERGILAVDAICEAARTRFRPILLTSLTTFIGLLPMMFERSLQAQFLVPMAVSLAFGVLFATALTLVLVPAIYLIAEDMRNVAARRCMRAIKVALILSPFPKRDPRA